jgi:cytochrome c553
MLDRMDCPWLIAMVALSALAGCQRESNTTTATSATSARNDSSAPARAPAAPAQLMPVTNAPPANKDVSAGRNIASQGAPGAAACSLCHGANGEGNGPAGFPRIAGLGRIYIEHQLNSYADGTRANPAMTPIAGALSAQQRTQVAVYFSGLGNAAPTDANAAADTNVPVLVASGDDKRGIQACANCHGPQGAGDAAANPYLAGQHAQYLTTALAEWKSDARHNDPGGQMPAIAKALSDAETRTIVAYYAGLPPPAARNAQAANK